MKRILPLIFALALLLTSCGEPKTKDYFTFKEESETERESGLHDNDIVMKVNGYDVSYSELRYYMKALDATKEQIEEKVLPELLLERSIALMAEEADIALTADEYKNLQAYLDETAKDEQYADELELAAMTDSLFRFRALQNQLTTKVYEYYTKEATTPIKASDDNVLATVDKGELIRIKHILIKIDSANTREMAMTEAEDVLQKLKNGESFDDLITLHSDYESQNELSTGEYVYPYEMPEQFEQAALSLEEGEISGAIYVCADKYTGYHIIMRLPPERAYVEDNLDTLRVNYMAYKFYETAYAKTKEMDIEYTELFDKIK